MQKNNYIIEAENVNVYFPVGGIMTSRPVGYVKAVDGLSLKIKPGETVGVVGESGSGKSTLGRAVLGLEPITGGSIKIHGKDIKKISKGEFRDLRRNVQMIFQDPYASLDPRQRIGDCLMEPMFAHKLVDSKRDAEVKAIDLLNTVGLSVQHFYRRPHEFSGGQRQRIGLARSLALNPEFLVCDEAVSALDVSIQASILNLFLDLQEKFDLTYMFISHDLRVVNYIADRIAVMYLGVLMELGETDLVYKSPLHPYTKALISAVPEAIYGNKTERIILEGGIPSPMNPPSGCRMHTRCSQACDICKEQVPELREVEPGHFVACHLV